VPSAPTLPALLHAAAHEAPDAEAFRYRDERLTYADWQALSDRLAAHLASLGVRRGDVVALLLPTTPLYLIAYLAVARLGAVTTGINVRYRRGEIAQLLSRSGAVALLAVEEWHQAPFRETVETLAPELRALRHVLWFDAAELRSGTAAAVQRLAPSSAAPPAELPSADDPVAIVWTSGTTGVPKGACYAHRSLMAITEIETRRHDGGRISFQRHLAAGLSFAHVGTMARIAIQIAHLGSSLIHDTFDPAAVLEAVEREGLAHLGGIPTQMIMLLDHPDRARRNLSSLRTVLIGGAPAAPDLIRRIRDTLNVVVSVRYSSTELGIATSSMPDDPPELLATTVGKATPGVELRVVDDLGEPVEAGTVGQVVVRSGATMLRYWNDPEQTARVKDADGWIHTGDLGFLDADGYLHLRGRESEMFIRGGFNVYPAEVENLLERHPKVARAAVLGVPDEKLGEAGWAFVTARDASSPPTLAELREFVGGELASFKRPDGVTVVGEMPLTPMFKVDKRALRTGWRTG
jgi:acyl-CoA synthetase (AMP-forming)/AMP-acid ligase II